MAETQLSLKALVDSLWVAIEMKPWCGSLQHILGRSCLDPFYIEESGAAPQSPEILIREDFTCR
jgi:hypothetical protein